MPNIFLISDTHFGHFNCYSFFNYDGTKMRPWDNDEEADEAMIERWNEIVRPEDKIYHLGDVAMNKNRADLILPRLNGKKCLIKGNHDNFKANWYLKYFYDIRGCYNLENYILTHIPIHPDSKARFKRNLHGHIHSNRIHKRVLLNDQYVNEIDPWYYNCCVEVNDYRPIPFENVKV